MAAGFGLYEPAPGTLVVSFSAVILSPMKKRGFSMSKALTLVV
jgi:hypothetical protein|tara:strand:- start:473 stop:601 length:129 start_codon:yes stop_codon:yes gene_type:complete